VPVALLVGAPRPPRDGDQAGAAALFRRYLELGPDDLAAEEQVRAFAADAQ
jgi:hypothetical protein